MPLVSFDETLSWSEDLKESVYTGFVRLVMQCGIVVYDPQGLRIKWNQKPVKSQLWSIRFELGSVTPVHQKDSERVQKLATKIVTSNYNYVRGITGCILGQLKRESLATKMKDNKLVLHVGKANLSTDGSPNSEWSPLNDISD